MGGKWGSGEIGCGLSCMIGGKWGSGEGDGGDVIECDDDTN